MYFVLFYVLFFLSFSVLFVCVCVLNYCQRVATHLLLYISYIIYHIYHVSYNIIYLDKLCKHRLSSIFYVSMPVLYVGHFLLVSMTVK